MEQKIRQYISDHHLFEPQDRALVAASAGVDSTVLCFLLRDLEVPFGMAHCNFQLRGEESDGDEQFVKNLAEQLGVPFFSTRFDTETVARKEKKSIQLTARELRYDWLFELAKEENYQKLVTAHHLDDNIETVLYNFTKGTGIKGMRGILPKKKNLVRPLLFCTKKEILAYAEKRKISFREDHSNFSDKYQRNKIRHQIIPVLESINPSFQKSAADTIDHLRDTELLYAFSLKKIFKKIRTVHEDKDGDFCQLTIHIRKLHKTPVPATVLFEIIKDYGFNSTHAAQILESSKNKVGSLFFSENYQLLVDRKHIVIRKKESSGHLWEIAKPRNEDDFFFPGGRLIFNEAKGTPSVFPEDKNQVFFDADKIQWPLIVRNWKKGDYFRPLGMHGKRKKLQDLFTDLKLSRWEKEKVWILESGGEICWVMGIRPDEKFKVSTKTTNCLLVKFLPTFST